MSKQSILLFTVLLFFGASLHSQNYEQPPLIKAIEANDLKQVKALVKSGADVNMAIAVSGDKYQFQISRQALSVTGKAVPVKKTIYICPMSAAAAQKNIDIVKFLLKKRANADAADSEGKTPLMYALREKGGEEVALYLLKKGANYVVEDYQGNTALHYAAFGGNEEGIRMAIAGGLDVNRRNKEEMTPLHAAAGSAPPATLELLISSGADAQAVDSAGMNAVFYAAASGKKENIILLSNNFQAKTSLLSKDMFTCMDLAAMNNHKELIPLLKERGAEHYQYLYKELIAGVKANDLFVVSRLLKDGANPNRIAPESPLHIAARMGHIGIAELLIQAMKNPGMEDTGGRTAFQLAVENSQYRMAATLFRYNPEVREGDIALLCKRLMYSPPQDMEGFYELLQKMIQPSSPLNSSIGEEKETALHYAVMAGDLRIVKMLLDAGAGVNPVNVKGWTPLHFACLSLKGGSDEEIKLGIVKTLQASGANLNATTSKPEQTPTVASSLIFPPNSSPLDIVNAQNGVYSGLGAHLSASGGKSTVTAADYVEVGKMYQLRKDHAGAEAAFIRAIALDKKNADAWLGKGEALRELGKNKAAIQAFGECLVLNATSVKALLGRGKSRFDTGDFSGAKDDFSKAITLDPADEGILYLRGQTYLKLKKKTEACADFQAGADSGDAKCVNSLGIHCK